MYSEPQSVASTESVASVPRSTSRMSNEPQEAASVPLSTSSFCQKVNSDRAEVASTESASCVPPSTSKMYSEPQSVASTESVASVPRSTSSFCQKVNSDRAEVASTESASSVPRSSSKMSNNGPDIVKGGAENSDAVNRSGGEHFSVSPNSGAQFSPMESIHHIIEIPEMVEKKTPKKLEIVATQIRGVVARRLCFSPMSKGEHRGGLNANHIGTVHSDRSGGGGGNLICSTGIVTETDGGLKPEKSDEVEVEKSLNANHARTVYSNRSGGGGGNVIDSTRILRIETDGGLRPEKSDKVEMEKCAGGGSVDTADVEISIGEDTETLGSSTRSAGGRPSGKQLRKKHHAKKGPRTLEEEELGLLTYSATSLGATVVAYFEAENDEGLDWIGLLYMLILGAAVTFAMLGSLRHSRVLMDWAGHFSRASTVLMMILVIYVAIKSKWK